jgi:hypothetical protein
LLPRILNFKARKQNIFYIFSYRYFTSSTKNSFGSGSTKRGYSTTKRGSSTTKSDTGTLPLTLNDFGKYASVWQPTWIDKIAVLSCICSVPEQEEQIIIVIKKIDKMQMFFLTVSSVPNFREFSSNFLSYSSRRLLYSATCLL